MYKTTEYVLLSCALMFVLSCTHIKEDSIDKNEQPDGTAFVSKMEDCEPLYLNDEQSEVLLSNIFTVSGKDMISLINNKQGTTNISFEKNHFDSLSVDTVNSLELKNNKITYYSTGHYKNVLLEAKIFSNDVPIAHGIKIGMPFVDFNNSILIEKLKINNAKSMDCFHFTTQAEDQHLYFEFSDDKLVSINYSDNSESIR